MKENRSLLFNATVRWSAPRLPGCRTRQISAEFRRRGRAAAQRKARSMVARAKSLSALRAKGVASESLAEVAHEKRTKTHSLVVTV